MKLVLETVENFIIKIKWTVDFNNCDATVLD